MSRHYIEEGCNQLMLNADSNVHSVRDSTLEWDSQLGTTGMASTTATSKHWPVSKESALIQENKPNNEGRFVGGGVALKTGLHKVPLKHTQIISSRHLRKV